jgi:hypothetical protein
MRISSAQEAISVGVAGENDRYCLATCERGNAVRRREFAVAARGESSLESFVADFKMPARIVYAATTAATTAMAVALGGIRQSEIFPASPSIASQSVELARYVKRSV